MVGRVRALMEPSERQFESVAKWYYHFPKACSDTGLLPCSSRRFSSVLCASGALWRAWLCEFEAVVEPSGRHFESVAKWYYHFSKACSDTRLLPRHRLGPLTPACWLVTAYDGCRNQRIVSPSCTATSSPTIQALSIGKLWSCPSPPKPDAGPITSHS